MAAIDHTGNLSADTQTPRMQAGIVALGVGLVLAAVMLHHKASIPVRLLLFIPFFVAAQLLLQGLFNTCAGLAARGMRDVGDGPETIADTRDRLAVKRLALKVALAGVAVAAAATALFVAMP